MAKYGLRRITTVPVLLFILLGGLAAGLYAAPSGPEVRSALALVVDRHTGQRLYAKNPRTLAPIASITKLMSAMVVLDSAIALDKRLVITAQDVDLERGSHSRLRLGSSLTVREALQVALMSSENRAASALARAYVMPKLKILKNDVFRALSGLDSRKAYGPGSRAPRSSSTSEWRRWSARSTPIARCSCACASLRHPKGDGHPSTPSAYAKTVQFVQIVPYGSSLYAKGVQSGSDRHHKGERTSFLLHKADSLPGPDI